MLRDATIARRWALQMSQALTRNGQHFGFGGATTKNWLQSVEMDAVTNGRISNDYHAEPEQETFRENWNIGMGSLFAWSLGLRPAKDGFWTTPVQPGHPYSNNRSEPYGVMHCAIATLSCGPVSPADKIGLQNRTTILRSCMEDGTLLQPDQPARSIDAQIERIALGDGSEGPEGEVWATTTTVDSRYIFAHALVIDLKNSYTLTPSDLGLLGTSSPSTATASDQQQWIVVENARGGWPSKASLYTASGMKLRTCGKADFQLIHVSPVLQNGWALLGELEKYVPVSKQRFRAISVGSIAGTIDPYNPDQYSLEVTLRGVPGESIAIGFAHVADLDQGIVRVDCIFPESGVLRASVPDRVCRDV
jgi:hypothetical protein